MKKIFKIFSHLFFMAALAAALQSCGNKNPAAVKQVSEDAGFEVFKNYYIEEWFRIYPSTALSAGRHDYDSILVVPSEETIAQQVKKCHSLLDSLKNYNENNLSEVNRIDYWMMRDNINSSIWYDTEFKSYEWNPSGLNVANNFAEILNGRYAPLETRLKGFSLRLKNVSAYYNEGKKLIKNPTIEHTELAILQNEGSKEEVFGKALKDSVEHSSLPVEEKTYLLRLADSAKAAMTGYVDWLKDKRKGMTPENSRSFRIGKELFDKKFQYDIVSKYTAEEIFAKAVNRRGEIHHEMAEITRSLWPKYFKGEAIPTDSLLMIRKMIDKLSLNHVTQADFLSSIKMQLPELIRFISDHNLIYIDPAKPLVVRKTPAYMEGGGAGASISAPGPFDKDANTYYNVTPLTGYAPEAAESYLREYNHYVLQILNIHEAIPGHYTQLVYSNNSPSLIKSLFGNGAMVEGWAVYTERMMLENGYGNNELEMWLMYYKWHLRSVCNTILDYSVHALNMSEADAKKLLIDGDFQQDAEAAGKWRRVKLTQVQLCSYFTGFTEIYDLRSEMQKTLGSKFELKKFHEDFLGYGSAPVKYISQLMLQPKGSK